MKIICSKEPLLKALSIAENVISNKNTLSVQSNVLLTAENGILNIKATETTLKFVADVPVEVIEPGSVAVFCSNLFVLIRKFNDTEIEISSDENNIVIVKQKNKRNSEYKHRGINAKDFPIVEIPEGMNFFSVPMSIISEMIRKTIFSVATDTSSKPISGVLFEKKDNTIKMVATDVRRFSFIKKDVELNGVEDCCVIVPTKVLNEVLKLSDEDGDIQIALSSQNLCMKTGPYLFISNLLEGSFPAYEKIIPTEFVGSVVLDRKLFLEMIDRVSVMGDKSVNKVVLSFTPNRLALFTENQTIGSGQEEMDIEYNGPEMDIGIRIKHLMDVLNVTTTPNVVMYFKDPGKPITVKQENDLDFIYIMAPISVN